MKQFIDGKYIEMTDKEIEEMEEAISDHVHVPTPEERLAALEEELRAAKILLGVEA